MTATEIREVLYRENDIIASNKSLKLLDYPGEEVAVRAQIEITSKR